MTKDAALAELLTLNASINEYGDTIFRNYLGHLHRIHGPAVVTQVGGEYWYRDNILHRTDGPAMIHHTGECGWYIDGIALTEKDFNERVR